MTKKFSIGIPEKLDELIKQACAVSGRNRNSACIDWILKGVLEELEMYKKAGLIQKVEPIKLDEDEDEESDL